MKPFNLKEALSGKPVVTRSGLPVTQLTLFQARYCTFNLYGVIDGCITSFNENGVFSSTLEETDRDLFMASEKKHGWINIYPNRNPHHRNSRFASDIHETEVIAKEYSSNTALATIHIEWEE